MNFRHRRQFRWEFLVLAIISALALSTTQNCSSTSGTGSLSSIGAGGVNSTLSAKPMPVQFSLNELSYMSCPMAATNVNASGDPLAAPFYQIRFGAFDNSAANGFIDPTFTNQPVDNVAGLGFSQNAMNYMRSINPHPTAVMLENYLATSPYSNATQPVVTVINQFRTSYSGGLAWTPLGTQVLVPLSNDILAPTLATATQIAGSGTLPAGYFATLPNGANSMLGSLAYAQSAVEEENFRTALNTQYIFAGFAPVTANTAANIDNSLMSPDNNVIARLFGLGYTFSFNYNDPSVAGIYEWDLNPSVGTNPVNLNAQNNEEWDCFSMTIVRDIDRKYWTVGTASVASPLSFTSTYLTALLGTSATASFSAPGGVIHPADVNTLGQGNPSLQMNYFRGGNPVSPGGTTNSIPYALFDLEYEYTPFAFSAVQTYNSKNNVVSPTWPNPSPGVTFNGNINNPSFGLALNYPAVSASGSAGYVAYPPTGLLSSLPMPTVYYPISGTITLGMGANGTDGGTAYACPPEDPADFVISGADTPATIKQKQLYAERLRIIRRFLTADNWEVNMSSNCVVPTAQALQTGACYASGDSDQTKYIQYNGVPKTNCGPGMNAECPAKVSFCWRYH